VTLTRKLAVGLILVSVFGACRGNEQQPPDGTKPASAAPVSNELPPISVKADTPNLLLTWVDEKGDFHVVQKPADVPATSRTEVRVVLTDREEGTGKLVYVADLGSTTPDGSYRIKTMTRAQWDELGASRRKARLEALAPSAVPEPSASQAPGAPGKPAQPAGRITAIIYGASWCKPCHSAEAYLKSRGVTVIDKDIDESDAARSEMQHKLERAGLGGASIPVIDVMGQILIGFSPRALDRAIEAAQASKPL
jgi:glutaredoxin